MGQIIRCAISDAFIRNLLHRWTRSLSPHRARAAISSRRWRVCIQRTHPRGDFRCGDVECLFADVATLDRV